MNGDRKWNLLNAIDIVCSECFIMEKCEECPVYNMSQNIRGVWYMGVFENEYQPEWRKYTDDGDAIVDFKNSQIPGKRDLSEVWRCKIVDGHAVADERIYGIDEYVVDVDYNMHTTIRVHAGSFEEANNIAINECIENHFDNWSSKTWTAEPTKVDRTYPTYKIGE